MTAQSGSFSFSVPFDSMSFNVQPGTFTITLPTTTASSYYINYNNINYNNACATTYPNAAYCGGGAQNTQNTYYSGNGGIWSMDTFSYLCPACQAAGRARETEMMDGIIYTSDYYLTLRKNGALERTYECTFCGEEYISVNLTGTWSALERLP